MLFWKAKEIFEGGGELLKAEAELAGARFKRALVSSFVVMTLGLLVMIGLITTLAGLVILLAPTLGWGGSLLCVGAGVMLLTGLIWLTYGLANKDEAVSSATGSIGHDTPSPQAEAAQAKERMAQAVDAEKSEGSASDNGPVSDIKQEAIEYALRNPQLVGGAALLALSIVGPGRSLRLLSRGVATASLVHSAIDALSTQSSEEDLPTRASQDSTSTASDARVNGVRR